MSKRARPYDGISEISKAGKHRWDDAQAMLQAGRWRGAMYLAGYTVECALKTKLMTQFRCHNLKELEDALHQRGVLGKAASVFSHQLELLLQLTGSSKRLRRNASVWSSFSAVNHWIPAWRYAADLANEREATRFMQASSATLRWIENNI